MKRFIVASASPRRKELLSNAGFSFEIIPSDADESCDGRLSPEELVRELAARKATSVFEKNTDAVVFGCDTVVEYEGTVLGKPESREEAKKMLSMLSGKVHNVHTGVCIKACDKEEAFVSTVKVEFYELSEALIDGYVATGESDDKAGAYGIQGLGSVLVRGIEGDYFSVVGLPVAETVRCLAEFGIVSDILKGVQ
ncbi:MAG: septum formation inhibitor Maf [Clostridia bacterium]|nr:septum formation inhibitor Maf [Clostridia bacterium]